MVERRWPEFTINFICHDEVEILARTLPHNLENLCRGTKRSYDVVVTIDGWDNPRFNEMLEVVKKSPVDEIRLRNRARNCASGDAANNGHIHAFNDKTRYLLTIEADIAFFRTDPAFDPLDAFARFFERHPDRALIHRMDDHYCWVWKLEQVAEDIEPGVHSVNRVASHFLVYDVQSARRVLARPDLSGMRDIEGDWLNYEDRLSHLFAEPDGPGIAFPESWPMQVLHCDRKIRPGSAHYCKTPDVKLAVFEQALLAQTEQA